MFGNATRDTVSFVNTGENHKKQKDKISKVPQKLYGEFQSLRNQRQLHRKENPPYRYNNALLILVFAHKTL